MYKRQVIGTNLNSYYPVENKLIQLEIEKKGLIVSPFSPATSTQKWNFPIRNGVMSGLSLATVILEAGERSGALIQADYALKQSKAVIIPKNIFENNSLLWPRKYLSKGAKIANKFSDVINIALNSKYTHQASLDEYIRSKFI